jgi:uncharacterized membrane protein (DUF4010 family)
MKAEALIGRLAVALAIGLLAGAERHWRSRDEAAGRRTAGVRTFALTGLLGGVMGALASDLGGAGGGILLAAGVLALLAALLPLSLREAEAEGRVSATSLVASLATYALGALAVLGEPGAAGAGAVAMVAVLAARESLHGLLARVSWVEMRSAIVLLSMTLLVLPLVPDAPLPWLAGINPHQVWRLAVLLAGVSFLGYLAVRLGDPRRGLLYAGGAAGLVSPTAVTVSNAARARQGGPEGPLAAGALLAGSVSCLRTLALVMALSPAVGALLWPGLLGAAAGLGVLVLEQWRGGRGEEASAPPGNPFEIGAVLRLALLLAAVGALARLGAEQLGGAAVLLLAAVTGLADVDAVTLSVPALAPASLSLDLAARAVEVAVATNIVAKAAYAAYGGRGYAGRFALGSALGLAGLLGGTWLAA